MPTLGLAAPSVRLKLVAWNTGTVVGSLGVGTPLTARPLPLTLVNILTPAPVPQQTVPLPTGTVYGCLLNFADLVTSTVTLTTGRFSRCL